MSSDIPPLDKTAGDQDEFAPVQIVGDETHHSGSPWLTHFSKQPTFIIGVSIVVLGVCIVVASLILVVGANLVASQVAHSFARQPLRVSLDGTPNLNVSGIRIPSHPSHLTISGINMPSRLTVSGIPPFPKTVQLSPLQVELSTKPVPTVAPSPPAKQARPGELDDLFKNSRPQPSPSR